MTEDVRTGDVDAILRGLGRSARGVLGADVETLEGYSRVKARALAQFAAILGEAWAAGELTGAELAEERAELDRMAARFARNLRGLAGATVERLSLEVAGALYRATGLDAPPPADPFAGR